MHERKAALILALILSATVVRIPAAAESADAATKAREGDVNHWIEYYRQSRSEATVRTVPSGGNGKEKPAAEKSTGPQPEADKKVK